MIGKLFQAPMGLGSLQAKRDYYFLRSDAQRVLFVAFDKRRETAHIECIAQSKVESAISEGRLLAVEEQPESPPWMPMCVWSRVKEEVNSAPGALGPSAGGSATLRGINARLGFISDANKSIETILAADDPQRALNEYARRCTPVQNEARFRTWVLVYRLFGRNPAALASKAHRRGQYKRTSNTQEGSLFGRLDNDGNRCAFRMTPQMIAKVRQSFSALARKGWSSTCVRTAAARRPISC